MGPETVLICYVANLPEKSMLVLVTVAAFNLMWMMALLLLPLLVAFVIDDFVSIFVRVELVMFMFVMLVCDCRG